MFYKTTAFTAATLLATINAAYAVELTGTIDGSSPLATDVGDPWCNPDDRVDVRPFQVSTSGTYGFSNLNVSGGSNLFVQINPTAAHSYSPLINADTYGSSPVGAAPTGTLTAGTQYYFVAITACTDAAATPVVFSVILSGDGDIVIEGSYALSDALPSLSSLGSSLTALSRSASLLVNGAHSRPLSRRVAEGEKTVWVAGDWGNDDHGDRNGSSRLAEMGVGYNFGPAQLNISLGKTWAEQDFGTMGSLDADSKYLLVESIIPVTAVENLYATAGAYYASGEVTAHRGYQAASILNYSSATPDTEAWGVRARLDWETLYTAANTRISPYVDVSYTETTVDAYTETGGAQPARFNKNTNTWTELRLGVNTATPMGASQFDFVTTLEGVHRLTDSSENITGSLVNIDAQFNIDGENYDQNWFRLGLGIEGDLKEKGKVSLMLNGTTEGETADSWVAATYQAKF